MKQIIGWIGVGLIVGAYGLNVFSVLSASDLVYGMMNLFGAASIIVSSYAKKDLQPVILNAFWILIALIGIVRSLMIV
jgi:hypothetical protein